MSPHLSFSSALRNAADPQRSLLFVDVLHDFLKRIFPLGASPESEQMDKRNKQWSEEECSVDKPRKDGVNERTTTGTTLRRGENACVVT